MFDLDKLWGGDHFFCSHGAGVCMVLRNAAFGEGT
ncbi:hypothetical protein PEC301877_26230 [Pectobacterium carotovorum subsp. carotovorum]|nr:hypothetical protein PEC301877_26230 [Pectobacterium carotovorum subsp. carotovorum]